MKEINESPVGAKTFTRKMNGANWKIISSSDFQLGVRAAQKRISGIPISGELTFENGNEEVEKVEINGQTVPGYDHKDPADSAIVFHPDDTILLEDFHDH